MTTPTTLCPMRTCDRCRPYRGLIALRAAVADAVAHHDRGEWTAEVAVDVVTRALMTADLPYEAFEAAVDGIDTIAGEVATIVDDHDHGRIGPVEAVVALADAVRR